MLLHLSLQNSQVVLWCLLPLSDKSIYASNSSVKIYAHLHTSNSDVSLLNVFRVLERVINFSRKGVVKTKLNRGLVSIKNVSQNFVSFSGLFNLLVSDSSHHKKVQEKVELC